MNDPHFIVVKVGSLPAFKNDLSVRFASVLKYIFYFCKCLYLDSFFLIIILMLIDCVPI